MYTAANGLFLTFDVKSSVSVTVQHLLGREMMNKKLTAFGLALCVFCLALSGCVAEPPDDLNAVEAKLDNFMTIEYKLVETKEVNEVRFKGIAYKLQDKNGINFTYESGNFAIQGKISDCDYAVMHFENQSKKLQDTFNRAIAAHDFDYLFYRSNANFIFEIYSENNLKPSAQIIQKLLKAAAPIPIDRGKYSYTTPQIELRYFTDNTPTSFVSVPFKIPCKGEQALTLKEINKKIEEKIKENA